MTYAIPFSPFQIPPTEGDGKNLGAIPLRHTPKQKHIINPKNLHLSSSLLVCFLLALPPPGPEQKRKCIFSRPRWGTRRRVPSAITHEERDFSRGVKLGGEGNVGTHHHWEVHLAAW